MLILIAMCGPLAVAAFEVSDAEAEVAKRLDKTLRVDFGFDLSALYYLVGDWAEDEPRTLAVAASLSPRPDRAHADLRTYRILMPPEGFIECVWLGDLSNSTMILSCMTGWGGNDVLREILAVRHDAGAVVTLMKNDRREKAFQHGHVRLVGFVEGPHAQSVQQLWEWVESLPE